MVGGMKKHTDDKIDGYKQLQSDTDAGLDIPPSGEQPSNRSLVGLFACGMSVSCGFTSILSGLVRFTELYGPGIFLQLCMCVYCPAVAIIILQARFDRHFDMRFGSKAALTFRIFLALCGMAVVLGVLPYIATTRVMLLLLTSITGALYGVAYGSVNQIVAVLQTSHTAACVAVFTSGFQASGLVVLALSLLSGFSSHTNASDTFHYRCFFLSTSALTLICLLLYFLLLLRSSFFRTALVKRDSSFSQLLSLDVPPPTFSTVVPTIWKCGLSLSITIAGTMLLVPWYTFIPSDGRWSSSLPAVIFYSRLLSDMLSRPATLVGPQITQPGTLLLLSCLRLFYVPFFFVYISPTSSIVSWKNDILMAFSVALFSFASGYLNTFAYKLAPMLAPPMHRSVVMDFMNLVFQLSIVVALAVSAALQVMQVL